MMNPENEARLVSWCVALQDMQTDLQNKQDEMRAIKEELDELVGFMGYAQREIAAAAQLDMFPFQQCQTARHAVKTYFSIYREPARVPDIARTLINGGYPTTAPRFHETVRMALLRMEEDTEAERHGHYWFCQVAYTAPQSRLRSWTQLLAAGLTPEKEAVTTK